jgi:pimeloyl-ACP methyl ester carboxylesterase
MPDIDISDLLPRIAAPTMVLAGDMDPIVPPGQSQLIAERVQNGELVMLERAGHLPTSERTVQYQRLLTDWLEHIA